MRKPSNNIATKELCSFIIRPEGVGGGGGVSLPLTVVATVTACQSSFQQCDS